MRIHQGMYVSTYGDDLRQNDQEHDQDKAVARSDWEIQDEDAMKD